MATFPVRLPQGIYAGETMNAAIPAGYPGAGQMVRFKISAGVQEGQVIQVPLPNLGSSNFAQPVAQPIAQPVVQPMTQPAPVVVEGGYNRSAAYEAEIFREERYAMRTQRRLNAEISMMEGAMIGVGGVMVGAEIAAIDGGMGMGYEGMGIGYGGVGMGYGGVGGAIVGSEIGEMEGAAIGAAMGGPIGAMEGAIIGSEIGAIDGGMGVGGMGMW
mmetsp:Transcript_12837/g.14818  ORF Transcript_12837/g.14818 Transcript_12837/m.14818 type:complete len:215 (+) Transcript_12837:408-1052(+)|eukprot:CAMPEP_0204826338 /NCGR_PEP_ID=MMETSP1346-20131115/4046_1 /ASSEMBLY_ACC=CAM_ASM_000771 /TAXON_ID=215587 /ORGANISM="Aplanochytrium stocchinoi, Strain GSBS06" /LENGTH=214 /DNA_ID=CAMNT_0051954315 /DNA_START=277 /DNA_END=921 /DNA_ORIENTATION=+